MIKRYVLAFLFDKDKENVLLIRKNRPDFQAGKLNGLGGKIEDGETPLEAVSREVSEESGINLPTHCYKSVGVIQNVNDEDENQFKVDIFFAEANILEAKTLTDEEVSVFKATEVITRDDLSDYVNQAIVSILKNHDF